MAGVHLLLPLLFGHVALSLDPHGAPRRLSPCQVVQMDVFCNGLNLRSAPTNLPQGIQMLDLSQNMFQNLTHETLAFHTTIHHLSLHSNKILFIEQGLFKGMGNLTFLDLSKNSLDVFALSKSSIGKLGAVQSLDLSSNGLHTGMTDVFLSESPLLVNLSLNSNSITKISRSTFYGSPALKRVSLHNNVILEIEDGAFDRLLHLTELDLSKNSITCITDFNLSNLKILNLSKNSLEAFQSVDSEEEYKLLILDLSQNKIHYFPLIPTRNKLVYLDVSRNRLQSVNATGTAEELEKFGERPFAHAQPSLGLRQQDFTSLKYLDLSYNQIKNIPRCFICTLVVLEVLNVSSNCVDSFLVDEEQPLNKLKVLDLSFNSLRNLMFGENVLRALKEVFLQGNLLATMDPHTFQRLPSVQYLHLQQNNVNICASQPKPGEYSISNKRQDPRGCFKFSSIPTLQHLYLSENNLKVLPEYTFSGTPLILLDLSLNAGLEVGPKALSGLEDSLVRLSLKENNISKLVVDLSSLNRLKLVDLSTNRLTTLEHDTLAALERSLKTLYMGSNPLSCCGNLRFFHMVQSSAVVVPDIASVTCVHTQDLEPVNVERVSEEMCHSLDNSKSITIIVVLVIAITLIVALGFMVKTCYSRRPKHTNTFNA